MNKKPPIGIVPRFIIERKRLRAIRAAICRYYDAELPIPVEWIIEYNELIAKNTDIQKNKF